MICIFQDHYNPHFDAPRYFLQIPFDSLLMRDMETGIQGQTPGL